MTIDDPDDGSGVPFSVLVDLVGEPVDGEQAVKLVGQLPDWSEYTPDPGGNLVVRAGSLSPAGSSPALASFNWLD